MVARVFWVVFRIWLCLRCYAAESILGGFHHIPMWLLWCSESFFNMVAIVFLVVFNMFLLYVVTRVFWELFITFTMVFLVVFTMVLLYVVAKGFWVLFSLLSMVFFNMLLPDVGGKSHMFKSQAILKSLRSSLKSQYKLIKQVKSSQWLTSSKSSRVLIRVKSSHSIKQEQIYFCHTTLLIFTSEINFFSYTFYIIMY